MVSPTESASENRLSFSDLALNQLCDHSSIPDSIRALSSTSKFSVHFPQSSGEILALRPKPGYMCPFRRTQGSLGISWRQLGTICSGDAKKSSQKGKAENPERGPVILTSAIFS